MTEIISTGLRDGQPFTITTQIDDTEIERRRTAAEARRAARQPAPILPGLTLVRRLTDAEYTAILNAAAVALAAGDAQLSRWIDELRVNGEVDLSSEQAQAAKAALVLVGLLTQERADALFAA